MRARYAVVAAGLDERQRRMWAGREALAYGRGGIAAAARVTGLARATIAKGMRAIELGETIEPGRVRRPGGGRRPLEDHNVAFIRDLERIVADEAGGDCLVLAWTTRSVRELARALGDAGHEIHYTSVARYLHRLGFSMQSNRTPTAAARAPGRGEQFRHVDHQVTAALARGDPAILVEVKHLEPSLAAAATGYLRGRNRGVPVDAVDPWQDRELRKLRDIGVVDVASDAGWVGAPVDADPAGFVVASIGWWWKHLGRRRCPQATTLTITAQCGADRQRARLWKSQLQRLADDTGLTVRVCHFPPGTSRWNHIEHRLHSFRARQWQGRSVASRKVVVSLIGNVDSLAVGRVYARLDEGTYPPRFSVPDAVIAALDAREDGEIWNYVIAPRAPASRAAGDESARSSRPRQGAAPSGPPAGPLNAGARE